MAKSRSWTPERKAKFQATMARKAAERKGKKARKMTARRAAKKVGIAYKPKKGGRLIDIMPGSGGGGYEVVERVILATAPDLIVAQNIAGMLRKG